MIKSKRVLALTVIILLCFMCFLSPDSIAQENVDIINLQKQFNELRDDFNKMKQYYETKISALEMKLEQSDMGCLPRSGPAYGYTEQQPNYSYSSAVMNPDISAIVNVQQRFNDDVGDDNRAKLTVGEAELNIGSMIFPDVRGDVTIAVENLYSDETDVDTQVHLEEAYITFLALPLNSQLVMGRKLIDFGLLNPVHAHGWPFPDTPLVLEGLFGHHPWLDDGIEASTLLPNPWDLYWNVKFGVWNGKSLAHHHHDDGDDETTVSFRRYNLENSVISWNDMVFTARNYFNIPFGDNLDAGLGYSIAWDEHPMTILHGFDLTMRYRFAGRHSWLKWQSEYIYAQLEEQNQEPADSTPHGFYSMLEYSINKYWRVGTRWDFMEYNENERFSQWANSYFITYIFNHNLYARAMYRYKDFSDFPDMHQEGENTVWFQLVWGLGPHSHGIAE